MSTQTQISIARQDPEIEAFRVGLLEDSQQLIRDQIFGRNVQNLRAQGLDDEAIAERLGRDVADVGNISQDQLFGPPDYDTADISAGEQQAVDLAQSGVGAYQPYLDQAGLGLADAQSLLGESAAGLRTAPGAAFGEALAGQAALGQAIQGGRDVAAGTRADITDAINAQRAIAGGAGEALTSQALQGQAGLNRASLIGNLRLGSQAARGQRGIDSATSMGTSQALQGQQGITSATDRSLSQALSGQQALNLAAQQAQQGLGENVGLGQRGIADAILQSRGEALGGQSALQGTTDFARGVAGAGARGMLDQAQRGASGLMGEARLGQSGAQTAADRARASTMNAQRSLAEAGGFGRRAAESGIGQLMGTTGGFDPSGIDPFMNQFEDAAVQQALADIGEAGERRRSQIGAEAAAAGAFGARRQLREAMLDEEILDQQTRAATQMRQAGFESAAQRAQKAFEDRMGRGQSAAMGTGQLGQAGAGTQIDAAGRGGQLGLGAENLAQTGSLQGAQLGLSAVGQGAQMGMDAFGRGAQLGMDAAGLGQRGDIAGTQFGMSAADAARAGATTQAQLGMQGAQLGGQFGLDAATRGTQFGMTAADAQRAGAMQGAQLGMAAADARRAGAAQGAQLGMQAADRGTQMRMDAAGRGAQLGMGAAETGARLGMGAESAGISGADIYGRYGMGAEDAAARGAIAGTGLGMDAIRTGMAADQGIAGLAGQTAGLGMNYGNLGQLLSGLSAADIDRLMTTGGLQRGINQAQIDATRMSNLQNYSQPFQQYGFLSDIYSQVPTGSSTMQVSSMPRANPFQTAVGLGIGAYGAMSGAQQAGIF